MNIRRTLVSLLSTIVVTLTMLGIVLINAQTSDEEPDLSYRTLDYDVAVQRNGDLKVTQHIDMRLKDRGRDWKQMYQRYTLKSKNLTDISDIGVKDVSNGETYRQGDFVFPDNADNWNDEHAGRWYIVDVTEDENDPQPFNPQTDGLSDDGQADKTLEIGWNIPQTVSEDSLKFDVSMTLHGVSTAYDDVVSFQWEPFGEENQIPIGTVTGKVTFPNGINGKNSWAWLHTKNTSTTNRGDNGSLMFPPMMCAPATIWMSWPCSMPRKRKVWHAPSPAHTSNGLSTMKPNRNGNGGPVSIRRPSNGWPAGYSRR